MYVLLIRKDKSINVFFLIQQKQLLKAIKNLKTFACIQNNAKKNKVNIKSYRGLISSTKSLYTATKILFSQRHQYCLSGSIELTTKSVLCASKIPSICLFTFYVVAIPIAK